MVIIRTAILVSIFRNIKKSIVCPNNKMSKQKKEEKKFTTRAWDDLSLKQKFINYLNKYSLITLTLKIIEEVTAKQSTLEVSLNS